MQVVDGLIIPPLQPWTPTLGATSGSPTFGNSAVVARWCQVGKMVFIKFHVDWGSTVNGGASGAIWITLPATSRNDAAAQLMPAKCFCNINGTNWCGTTSIAGNSNACYFLFPVSATNASTGGMCNVPALPAVGNYPIQSGSSLSCEGWYEAA